MKRSEAVEAREIEAAAESVWTVLEALPIMFSVSDVMPADHLMHALGVLRQLAAEKRAADSE